MSDTIIESILPLGTKLHEYQIQRVLGVGGFGITYLAVHQKLQSQVAIKEYMPNDFSYRTSDFRVVAATSRNWNQESDREDLFEFGLKRFLKEARDLVRFNHPSIVRAINYFEANGTGYIVMDYVEGQTLKAWLSTLKALPDEEQLKSIFLPLLDGLGEVHRNGLLHRDIKPDNIYIRANGSPLLLDFGTARDVVSAHSQTLHVVVSRGYSPKEQYALGSKQGPWTDIYSVGGVLYFCVSGDAPPGALERMSAIDSGGQDLLLAASLAYRERFSIPFLNTIDHCLGLNASDRPSNVYEVINQLTGNATSETSYKREGEGVFSEPMNISGEDGSTATDTVLYPNGPARNSGPVRHSVPSTIRNANFCSHNRADNTGESDLLFDVDPNSNDSSKRSSPQLPTQEEPASALDGWDWESTETSNVRHVGKPSVSAKARQRVTLLRGIAVSLTGLAVLIGVAFFGLKWDWRASQNSLAVMSFDLEKNKESMIAMGSVVSVNDEQALSDQIDQANIAMAEGENERAIDLMISALQQQNSLLASSPRRVLVGSNPVEIENAYLQCQKQLGSSKCAVAWFNVEAVRSIVLTPYAMNPSSVTFEQFQEFVEATGYKTLAEQLGYSLQQTDQFEIIMLRGFNWRTPEGYASRVDDHLKLPVTHAAYADAVSYCKHIGARLPTRDEWEYAAMHHSAGLYANYFNPEKFEQNTRKRELGVLGSVSANSLDLQDKNSGLYGMTANVWEWTQTRDESRGSLAVRYLKGGSWNEPTTALVRLTAVRSEFEEDPHIDVGFRCARSVEQWP